MAIQKLNLLIILFVCLSTGVLKAQKAGEQPDQKAVQQVVDGYLNFLKGQSNNIDFLASKSVFVGKPYRDTTDQPYFNLAELRQLYQAKFPDGYEVVLGYKKMSTSQVFIDQELNTYALSVTVPQKISYLEISTSQKIVERKDSTLTDSVYTYQMVPDTLEILDTIQKDDFSQLHLYLVVQKVYGVLTHKLEAVSFNKMRFKHQPLSDLTAYWVSLSPAWKQMISERLNFPEVPSDYYLERISGLTSLDLSKSEITDFSPLLKFTGLKRLELQNRPVDTLSYIQHCTRLNYLNVSNCSLTSLEGVQGMIYLEELKAASNQIDTLYPLRGLKELSLLNLNENKIKYLDALAGMRTMQRLYLDLNEIRSLEPLSNMLILSELFVRKNRDIESLEPLRNCQTLWKLDCFNTNINSLDPIKNNVRLIHLDCSHTSITSLAPLKGMISLMHLAFEANKLTDFSVLNSLDELRYLNCAQTNISDISSIMRMGRLRELYAIHTELSKSDIQRFKKKHPKVAITYY